MKRKYVKKDLYYWNNVHIKADLKPAYTKPKVVASNYFGGKND